MARRGTRAESLPGCPAGFPPVTLDGHLQLGDLADVGGHHALGPDVPGGEHAERPGPGGGEEPESAVLAERHLSDKVTTGVEQARVADRYRRSVPRYLALHHGLGSGARGRAHLRPAGRRGAASGAHLPSPTSIGTPTREPYSVHEPS